MSHPNGIQPSNISSSLDLGRVESALRDNETFSRVQVACLMSLAGGWGYDAGYEDGQRDEMALASVSAAYAQLSTYLGENTAREVKKVERRREADDAARVARIGDHLGGPVATWDEDVQVAA